ncbi:aminomethyl-transferring glycine dehydrogenase subunit GcvPA [Hahella sp. SMD15-11]|uniref:Probable glycine dehydrogenase (decarboxylating) subunit 1 n=1 Tax=Thermohahella caldifontis TaxID=3142973 RepID=A0AB39UVR4_9GAMM
MPFIPHTDEDRRLMLEAIGVASVEDLFDEIPADLRAGPLTRVPEGRSEMAMLQHMQAAAEKDRGALCFLGGGAWEHHIPAAVWDIASRGEFMTAYTPYQAEASQGTLQLIYEYQTMMANLMAMDISNASLYDGASALAEAVLMSVRLQRKLKNHRILLPRTVNPRYRSAVRALVEPQDIELVEVPFNPETLTTDPEALEAARGEGATALVLPFPNYFGKLEDVHALTDWAAGHGMLVIALVNPLAMSILTPPGEWGAEGADIAVGDGQPFGLPLSSGGPYFGFMVCRESHVRQMPGRIIGQTVDGEGKRGFTLTLQAREQHIRRGKATSNICTNQGLAVTAATIHMALLGAEGLANVARQCHHNAWTLRESLRDIPGISLPGAEAMFHEFVVRTDKPVADVLDAMDQRDILAGIDLSTDYPELGDAMLVAVTETRTPDHLATYKAALADVMGGQA